MAPLRYKTTESFFGTVLYVGQAPCQSSRLLNCLDHKVAVEGLGFRVWDVELGLEIRSAVYNMDCFIQDLTRCENVLGDPDFGQVFLCLGLNMSYRLNS